MKGITNCSRFTTVRSQIATVAGCWFVLALFVGEMRLLGTIPISAVQGIVLGFTIMLLAAWNRFDRFRAWLDLFDVRLLTAPHLVRFAGIYVLALDEHGELPDSVATSAGWREIWLATTALTIICLPLNQTLLRWCLLGWNLAGLFNILFIAGLVARLQPNGVDPMEVFNRLPLSLFPTFITPILVFTHLVIFTRLRSRRSNPSEKS